MKNRQFTYLLLLLSAILTLSSCWTRKLDKLSNKVYMERNYNELKDLLPEAQVTIVNDTIKILFPNNLLFKTAQSELSSTVDPLMERFAVCLNKYKKTSIMVTGHTDNVGNFESNIALSTKRAESASNRLAELKVVKERLHTWGHGDQYPIASNDAEETRILNRRVEFIILINNK